MVQSMTGYASAIVDIPIKDNDKLSLSLHIKSLNSRYFEATCKVPYLLNNLEVATHKILKKHLHRGHVYLTIKIQNGLAKQSVVPSLATIQGYLKAITTIKKECKISEDISLQTLLQLPNILQIEEEALSKKAEELILKEIEILTEQLIKTRIAEGKNLAKDIKAQTTTILKKLATIKIVSAKILKEKKASLDTIMNELQRFNETEQSANQCLLETQKTSLLTELEKMDIHEEIVRASSHLETVKELLTTDQIIKGKKLDFILQELNRETNTIASKCSNFEISSLTIDIKAELEKCREQAQNIV